MASATLDPFDCLKHWVGTKFISKNCTKRNFWWNYKFIFFPGLPINSIQNCSVSTKMNMFGLHYTGTVPNIRVIDVNPQISIWYIYPCIVYKNCIYPSLFAAHILYSIQCILYTVYTEYTYREQEREGYGAVSTDGGMWQSWEWGSGSKSLYSSFELTFDAECLWLYK